MPGMSDSISSKWNARYTYSGASIPAPAEVLSRGEQWLPSTERSIVDSQIQVAGRDELPPRAEQVCALDLACGRAGNAYWLAEKGFTVSAWDISSVVIDEIKSRQPQVLHDVQERDVNEHPPAPESFDIIVVVRFLERSLCPFLVEALKPEGVLYYQTFTQGLANPDYLLQSNELPRLFSALAVLDYRESGPAENGKSEAMLIARKS